MRFESWAAWLEPLRLGFTLKNSSSSASHALYVLVNKFSLIHRLTCVSVTDVGSETLRLKFDAAIASVALLITGRVSPNCRPSGTQRAKRSLILALNQ